MKKRPETQKATLEHRRFINDVIDRANRALKPVGVKVSATLPKRVPTGGAAFVPIPVELSFIGSDAKKVAGAVGRFEIHPVVAEMESHEFRSVFAVSTLEEALKLFGADLLDRRRRMLALFSDAAELL